MRAPIDALRRALANAAGASGRGSSRRPGKVHEGTLAQVPLEPLADTGLAHWHVRLRGTGWLARIPKQSQLGLAAGPHLAYEAACFERAAASGHAPALHRVLAPGPGLERGALIVDEIQGRALRLPDDLGALVQALAALHALPLPPPAARAPLIDPVDPLAALADEIERQCRWWPEAGVHDDVRRRIEAESAHFAADLAAPQRPPRRLIAFDAHPGNFIVRPDGRAVLVDLEKARYGAAALDLAHATAYTSTTWDVRAGAALELSQVRRAARLWLTELERRNVDPLAERHWIAPMRRAMALWSLSWCAKWRALSGRPRAALGGEDWSSELSDEALVRHVRERVDHYLSTAVVARLFDEADALA